MSYAEVQVMIEANRDLLRGEKGDPGESVKGDPGPPGESVKGDQGVPGKAGKSIRGEPGPRGPKGDPGKDGKSIKGDPGPPGKDGVGPDEKVRVSQGDPKAGFLADKLTAGSGIEIRTAGGKRGERLVIDAKPQGGGGGGQSGIIAYDDGVAVGAGNKVSFDGGDPVTISGGLIHVPVGSGGGGDQTVYVQDTDPGDVAAGSLWVKTDPGPPYQVFIRTPDDPDPAFWGAHWPHVYSGTNLAFTESVNGWTMTSGTGQSRLVRSGAGQLNLLTTDGINHQANVILDNDFVTLEAVSIGVGQVQIVLDAVGGDPPQIRMTGVPTADPSVADAIWADDGVLVFSGSTAGGLPGSPETYTETNVVTDRAFDASASTLDEVLHVLGSLISDLRARGVVA